ncbi:MAG TPA: chemotaxis protein CheW [Coleofasciculaceae cyanobacterium]|jgi:purine-binding chemotaxis protein CheW
MENKQYLTFHWHNLQYGIEAALVQELFPLPELTPIAEAATDIIGILNLRGQIVPMIHLDLLQGHPVQGCQLSDYVIVVQWEGLQFGMVVHQVDEVLELNTEVIETVPSYELIGDINAEFLVGVTKVDAGSILLLNPKKLTPQLDAVLPLVWDAQIQLDVMAASPIGDVHQQLEQEVSQPSEELQISNSLASFYDLYCPNATPEERAIFRQRADNLKPQVENVKVTSELMPLAVIGFNNEYFGLDLELVREFTDIGNLTPIPCCPSHIVGNMNLRGEIVTLVDIRTTLNLPSTPISIGSEVVVVQVDDIVAGFPVDQVLEMAYLNSADMAPLSGILSDFGEQYIRGTALFQEKMLKVLDLPKIFTQGELVVNEEA